MKIRKLAVCKMDQNKIYDIQFRDCHGKNMDFHHHPYLHSHSNNNHIKKRTRQLWANLKPSLMVKYKRNGCKLQGRKWMMPRHSFACSSVPHILNRRPPWAAKKGANTSDSTAMSLIRMLSEGPEVSFRGSPIVSPMTAALCGSDPLGPRVLACSEAPAYRMCGSKKSTKLNWYK